MNQKPHKTDKSKTHRRQLRRASTKPEQLVWAVVRNRRLEGLKFRRQQSIDPFIVDFVCQDLKLIIEIDGGYHDDIFDADRNRQQYLEAEGYRVVRFANEDVLEDVAIAREVKALDWKRGESVKNRTD